MRVRTPAEMPGAVEHFLDAHFENDIRVRANPWSPFRHLAQQGIKRLARFVAILKRIDPHKDAVGLQQLRPNLVGKLLVIDGWLGMNADRGELFEDAMKAIIGRGRIASRLAIATPDNRNFRRSHGCFPSSGKGLIVKLSKWVMLSALVHSATLPASAKVVSRAVYNSLQS